MFQTVRLSIIRNFPLYTQHCNMSYRFADSQRAGSGRNVLILLAGCVTYTIAVCTVENSWWWTEELSETYRVLFQKQIWEISISICIYYKNLSRCTATWTSKISYSVSFPFVLHPHPTPVLLLQHFQHEDRHIFVLSLIFFFRENLYKISHYVELYVQDEIPSRCILHSLRIIRSSRSKFS